jgi:iron uptake system component EfeO
MYVLRTSLALLLLTAMIASGCGSGASGEPAPESRSTSSDYKIYLDENVEKLQRWVDTIVLKAKEGSFPKAGSRYAAARVPYGHIYPAAQLFGPLNTRMDALESQLPPGEYAGFHQIEKTIFWEETTETVGPLAKQVRANLEELQRRIDSADLQPGELLGGANEVLKGVLVNEIWGIAEPYSHIDLVDIAAKAEGVDAAFAAAKPALATEDPELAAEIEAQLRKTLADIGEYGILASDPDQARPQEPGIAFVVYDQLTQEERWDLAEPIKELVSLLSQADEKLADP